MKAYLYTWGEGRNTAEGEHIPVRIESLDIGYIDGQLLLPLIEEHTIDERSPLCGHTYMSLKSVSFVSVQTACPLQCLQQKLVFALLSCSVADSNMF